MNWHDPSNEMSPEFRKLAKVNRDEQQKELSWKKIQKRIGRPRHLQWLQQLYIPTLTTVVLVVIATGVWMAKFNDIGTNPKGAEDPEQEMIVPNPVEESNSNEDENLQQNENPQFVIPDDVELMPIADQESLEVVARFEIGKGQNEVGHEGKGKSEVGPTSFFVRDDTVYVLDRVNSKVVMHREGKITTFPITADCRVGFQSDMYVSPDKEIYILDNSCWKVYHYDESGNLLEDPIPLPENINNPTGFGVGPDGELVIKFLQSGAYSLYDHERVDARLYIDSPISHLIRTSYSGDIGIITIADSHRIEIPYEQSFGGFVIHDATYGELIIEKTEVAPNTTYIAAESFIQSIGLDGTLRGGARIPLERMTYLPDHVIRVDGQQIYLFSVEEDAVYIYRVYLGKEFESIRFADLSISKEAFSLLTKDDQAKITNAKPEVLMHLYFSGINDLNPLMSLATLHPDLINHEESLESAKGGFVGYKAANIRIQENVEKNKQVDTSKEYHLIVDFEVVDLQEGSGWVAGEGKQTRFVKLMKTTGDIWSIRALATSP